MTDAMDVINTLDGDDAVAAMGGLPEEKSVTEPALPVEEEREEISQEEVLDTTTELQQLEQEVQSFLDKTKSENEELIELLENFIIKYRLLEAENVKTRMIMESLITSPLMNEALNKAITLLKENTDPV